MDMVIDSGCRAMNQEKSSQLQLFDVWDPLQQCVAFSCQLVQVRLHVVEVPQRDH